MLTSRNVILQGVKKETQGRTREIFHADFCQDQLAMIPMDTPRYAVPCSMGNPIEEGLQPPAAAKEGTCFQIQNFLFCCPMHQAV